MIIYSSGDIFESNTVALVNAVNCQGVMGKGIAYQFKEKFPENFINYKLACDDKRFNIGDILITNENEKMIVNFPTKDTWRKKSQYEYIEKGLVTLKNEIVKRGIPSISIPPLGCGNGGLDWERVENLIINAFSDLDFVEIVLYPPVIKKEKSNHCDFNINHLIVIYAMEHLEDKKRYSLNTLFYLCQKVSGYNAFNFSLAYGRAYSTVLEETTDDIKVLKEKYGEKFNQFINHYINTNLSKKLENNFQSIIKKLERYINLLNCFENKEEYSEVIELIEMFLNKETSSPNYYLSRNKELKEIIIKKMVNNSIIRKNIFEQYEVILDN